MFINLSIYIEIHTNSRAWFSSSASLGSEFSMTLIWLVAGITQNAEWAQLMKFRATGIVSDSDRSSRRWCFAWSWGLAEGTVNFSSTRKY